MKDRPEGVVAISALCVILAAVSLLIAALIVSGQVALSSGAFLLGGGFEQLGPLAFGLYAVVLLLLAVGLWMRWSWARRVGILLAVAGIAFAVPAISSAVADSHILGIVREGTQIILRVLIVFYLTQEPVKDWFATKS